MDSDSLPIRISNPRRLGGWRIPAERIPLGIAGDYKPKLVLLPNGELLLFAFCCLGVESEGTYHEPTLIYRSQDGGASWSERAVAEDIVGREHGLTCTSDGTLFCSTHLIAVDKRNRDGVSHSYLHRSTDGGESWQATKLSLDAKRFTGASSTVVELGDGRLLFGVSVGEADAHFLWESHDGGLNWDRSAQVRLGKYHGESYENSVGFFTEDFTFQISSGKWLHWIRLSSHSSIYPMNDGRIAPGKDDDQTDRMLLCESSDHGATWSDFVDFGDYGMLYPRVIRLHDGRLLMTYTQRSLAYPLGLRAVLSEDDGESWDFESDRIIIEGKTPWGLPSGGGFGNTVQLTDENLVSCYSYRGADDLTHVEIVRWSLQAPGAGQFEEKN